MADVDPYSLAALPLEMLFDGTVLATGTGFIWEQRGRYFLVTNWHVMTGRHPQTGKHLSNHAGEPNRVRIPTLSNMEGKQAVEFALYDDDGQPQWMVHPKFGNQIDVVVMEIQLPDAETRVHPINTLPSVRPEVKISIAFDVYVLGFPLGIGNGFPIWKRASVATEPELGGLDQPILIDTATRSGMSGAPVIWRGNIYSWKTGTESGSSMGGTYSKFVGIYSARTAAKDTIEAQLGYVWRAAVIEEIITGGIRDKAAAQIRMIGHEN
jgi:Trypsin-like peptidase domain